MREIKRILTSKFDISHYAAHKDLEGAFQRPARTILNQTGAALFDTLGSTQAEQIRERVFLETPRWLVLEDEALYRKEQLGLETDPAGLDDQGKMAVLTDVFGPKAASSGVLFVEKYEAFRQELEPTIEEFRDLNLTGLEAHFIVSGIVQKCGTRGAFERLFRMVRLSPQSSIDVKNLEDPEQVEVVIKGDLFSLNLFLGLISPDTFDSGKVKFPRIFHGIDIGWGLAPHNLVVAAVSRSPLELPQGMHMYTINVESVSPTKLWTVRGEEREEVEIPSGIDFAALQLKLNCHGFVAHL